MTHTSTEQPEALRLADLCAADWDLVRPHLVVQMLRDLHARVQELEASQAQRVPMTERADFCAIIKNHLQQYSSTRLCCHNSVPALAKSEFDEVAAEIASDLLQAARRAPVVPQRCDLCKNNGGYFYGRTGYEPCCVGSLAPQPPEAAPMQIPGNIREGEPYDNPAFEALARALGVWGTAQSAVCAQFWIAAKEQST